MTTIQIRNNQLSPVHCSVRALSNFQLGAQKCDQLHPPVTHTFLKRPFLTDFKKYTHTPPPNETKFWHIRPKGQKPPEKWQNPPHWHKLNVPERNVYRNTTKTLLEINTVTCKHCKPGAMY